MRATIDNLDEAIMAELENWNEEIKRAVNEGLEETAAVAAETLRQGGPYQERTKKYKRLDAWRKKTKSVSGYRA